MHQRIPVPLIAACCTLACGGPELCDGSDEVRWVAYQGFGGREYAPPFVAVYGERSVSIDGQCHFWLYDASQRGLRHGVIPPGLETSIEDWSHYGSYASLYDPSYEELCDDAPRAWISDGSATLSAACVSTEAPADWHQAVRNVDIVAGELDAISQHVWRPVQILPFAVTSALPSQPIYDWNAPFDLAAYAVSDGDDPRVDRDATGIPVDDPAVLARLDELRTVDIAAGVRGVARGLFVRDASGRIFQLFVRDEQPEGLFADPTKR